MDERYLFVYFFLYGPGISVPSNLSFLVGSNHGLEFNKKKFILKPS